MSFQICRKKHNKSWIRDLCSIVIHMSKWLANIAQGAYYEIDPRQYVRGIYCTGELSLLYWVKHSGHLICFLQPKQLFKWETVQSWAGSGGGVHQTVNWGGGVSYSLWFSLSNCKILFLSFPSTQCPHDYPDSLWFWRASIIDSTGELDESQARIKKSFECNVIC